MLNLRKTIIFCILFAAVWVQSTKAVTAEEKNAIEHLQKALIHAMGLKYRSKDGVNHFSSWESWKYIYGSDKFSIASQYKTKLEKENLNFNSGIDDKSQATLARLAYEALDDHIKFMLELIRKCPKIKQWVVIGMEKLAEQGQFLEYLAFHGGDAETFLLMTRRYDEDSM